MEGWYRKISLASMRRRRNRRNIGVAELTLLECAGCGVDVLAPADVKALCPMCTMRLAVRAAAKRETQEC